MAALSHSFERLAGHYIMIHAGVSIAYAESIEKVVDNMREIGPTVRSERRASTRRCTRPCSSRRATWRAQEGDRVLGAPDRDRVLRAEVGGGGASAWLRLQRSIADRLVFAKIRDRVGGNIRFFVSGSARWRLSS